MNTSFRLFFIALALTSAAAVRADDRAPVGLELTTQDDDLRAGGEVSFMLRMFDGTEQGTVLVRGERLADRTTSKYNVSPNAPYTWSDVQDWGLHVRAHPGDGLALRPDTWRVYAVLRGIGGSCSGYTDMSRACFGYRNASWQFTGDNTQYLPLSAVYAKCHTDDQCNGGNFCGTDGKRHARCEPRAHGADRNGCLAYSTPQPACMSNARCDEAQNRCVTIGCEQPDADGDGHARIACGGDDCDDNDANRHPGNPEVCNDGHDEDCDVTTVGNRDRDGDGFIDGACWNAR